MSEPAKRGRGRPAKKPEAQAVAPAPTAETQSADNQPQTDHAAPAVSSEKKPEAQAAAPEAGMDVVLQRKYVPAFLFEDGEWVENVYDGELGGMTTLPAGSELQLKQKEAIRAIRKGIAIPAEMDFGDE